MTWQIFSAGFLYGFTAGMVLACIGTAIHSRRARRNPRIRTKVTITVTVRLTCSCGHVNQATLPYEQGMSELAVTCDGCGETTWMPVPEGIGTFASDG